MNRRLNSKAAGRGEENHILTSTTMRTAIVVCKSRPTGGSRLLIQGDLVEIGDQTALHDVSLVRANRGALA